MTEIWLDVTRLLQRACAGALSGIDRVELAYATLLPEQTDALRLVVFNRWTRRIIPLPEPRAGRFIAQLAQAWAEGTLRALRPAAIRLLGGAALRSLGGTAPAEPPIYLLVSHRHLDAPDALATGLRRDGARLVPLIHDLIPLQCPEYVRPAEVPRHARRVAAVRRLAAGVVVNSLATGQALQPFLRAGQAIRVAPLGVTPPDAHVPAAISSDPPRFVCLGTIEPRKNHILLLHIWRELVTRYGDAAPHLLLVGRRGWENEHVVRLLDRSPALRSVVRELGILSDAALRGVLRGARALVMPSFAEGFGLPVAEALALGVPVLCSDLPALREAGGPAPEYLHPLDAPGWARAVLDYAATPSPRREAQLARIAGWRPVTWRRHVADVLAFAQDATR